MRSPVVCALLGVLVAPTIGTAQSPLAQNGVRITHATASLEPVTGPSGRSALLLLMRVEDGWHVSYRNPGETGLPTRLQWSLPADVRVANETWPVPIITHTDVGVTHTLEGTVPWLIEFDAPRTTEDRLVSVTVRYGVCRDVCIPAQLTVQGALPGSASPAPGPLPDHLRTRLIRNGGVIAARRVSPTMSCLTRTPLADVARAPEVLADTTLMLPVSVMSSPGRGGKIHGLFMKTPAETPLRSGSRLLFVRDGVGLSARLDFSQPAPECRPR